VRWSWLPAVLWGMYGLAAHFWVSAGHGPEAGMGQEALGYERDIRPLFREKDVSSMAKAFDLSSYDDVRAHADGILSRVADGSMPCDGPWPQDRVELFRSWVEAGCPA
jgi:hypothetical protein